jgi:CRP-like cAMP-binding protein
MDEIESAQVRLRFTFQNSYFFHPLALPELDQLIRHLTMKKVEKGTVIIKQGDKGDAFYLIASGRVSVWIEKDSKREKVAELKTDEHFGEMALISHDPRNATVIAEEFTELFVLQKTDFDKILMQNPVISKELQKAYDERKNKII